MKDKIIAVRISNVLWDKIEEYSKIIHSSKSEIAREALTGFLNFYLNPIPFIFWGKNEFSFALNCLKESDLEKLAEINFKNSLNIKDYLIQSYSDIKDPKSVKLNPRFVINLLITTFSSKGQNWFNQIKAIWKHDWLMILGNHENGLNFSIYVKYIFLKWMDFFSFKLLKEEIHKNQIVLEFEKKE